MNCLFPWRSRSFPYDTLEQHAKKDEDWGKREAESWQRAFPTSQISELQTSIRVQEYAKQMIRELKRGHVPLTTISQPLIEEHLIRIAKHKEILRSTLLGEIIQFRNNSFSKRSDSYEILTEITDKLILVISDDIRSKKENS